ncbi:type II CRISPR RNA-guided endonuclease Cas9 [Candidatus Seongchinamella marina]|uniref:type II CRISPR RNA-guided endonuclease Cas9 n=1 Tax=Candidatus Seongchinamella marina TaxID=2518990 RepID=UPI0024329EB0|nr:type II CRISPR RNA-guided endonuclease Cas9 [Candidatus Seongchinamella marina]
MTEKIALILLILKACGLAGYAHSNRYTGEWHRELPYYGEILHQYTGTPIANSSNADEAKYGRIANPTVHVALNQLRKVINAIVKKYGHPDEIHIEVVRDLKLSQKAKRELQKTQKKNQERNERHGERLAELGQKNTYDNRLRLTLWEELAEDPMDRCCPFSGKRIGIQSLFTADVQIEHLIPFADCLDDSQSNKTLATRKANNDKGKRTPHEAFGDDQGGYCWDDILDRAHRLPVNKQRRFAPDARSKFCGDEWLARQLNDTAYISRVARQYLTAICNPSQVRVSPGRLTALFRRALSLEKILSEEAGKNRHDHRHHAIDAVVVALTDASLIKTASYYASRGDIERLSDRLNAMEPPWKSFYSDVKASIERLVVSYKPDHGVQAALHNETAYGLVSPPDDRGVSTVRYRKAISALKEKDLDKVTDQILVAAIQAHVKNATLSYEKALLEFVEKSRAKKCTVEERMSVITIEDAGGTPYKGYKGDGNYCYEIEDLENGKWGGRVISSFEANQAAYRKFLDDGKSKRISYDGRPLVMRLCRDDIVAFDYNGRDTLMRVATFSSGKISFAALTESNVDARNRDKNDVFKYVIKSPNSLRKVNARRVFIDVIGAVKDPTNRYGK